MKAGQLVERIDGWADLRSRSLVRMFEGNGERSGSALASSVYEDTSLSQ